MTAVAQSQPGGPPPRTANGLQPAPDLSKLYHAEHLEVLSLKQRVDAMRSTLNLIAHGAEHPSFTAAKAVSADDDMSAAYRIAKGLFR